MNASKGQKKLQKNVNLRKIYHDIIDPPRFEDIYNALFERSDAAMAQRCLSGALRERTGSAPGD